MSRAQQLNSLALMVEYKLHLMQIDRRCRIVTPEESLGL